MSLMLAVPDIALAENAARLPIVALNPDAKSPRTDPTIFPAVAI